MITQTTLKGKRVILEPLEDIEYFLNLAERHNKNLCSKKELNDYIKTNGGEFWLITLNGIKRGVVGYFKDHNVYVMEAVKDNSAPPTGISYSIEVGELVIEYIFNLTDRLRTCALVKDKAIQILCKKLGFREISRDQDLIIYERVK
jgi:hypothetical protein